MIISVIVVAGVRLDNGICVWLNNKTVEGISHSYYSLPILLNYYWHFAKYRECVLLPWIAMERKERNKVKKGSSLWTLSTEHEIYSLWGESIFLELLHSLLNNLQSLQHYILLTLSLCMYKFLFSRFIFILFFLLVVNVLHGKIAAAVRGEGSKKASERESVLCRYIFLNDKWHRARFLSEFQFLDPFSFLTACEQEKERVRSLFRFIDWKLFSSSFITVAVAYKDWVIAMETTKFNFFSTSLILLVPWSWQH